MFDNCKSQNIKSYLVYDLSHENEKRKKRRGGGEAVVVLTAALPPGLGSQCLVDVPSFNPDCSPVMSAL